MQEEDRISRDIGQLQKEKSTLQETVTELKHNILTKESEIAVLQDCVKQLKNDSDEEIDDKLQVLLDVGSYKAELKFMTIERDTLAEKLQGEVDARKLLEGKVYFCIFEEVLTFFDQFTALCFTVTSAPQAAKHIHIFPKNQYAYWPVTFGMK